MTSMPTNTPPGLPAALRTAPDLWAITLPGETVQDHEQSLLLGAAALGDEQSLLLGGVVLGDAEECPGRWAA